MTSSIDPTNFTILHISDFHRKDEKQFIDKTLQPLISDVGELAQKPDVIVVSGDLVEEGEDNNQYKTTTKFLKEIYKHFFPSLSRSQDKSRLIIVPGNHDVDHKICRKSPLSSEPEKEEHYEESPHTTRTKGAELRFKKDPYRNKFNNFASCFRTMTGKSWEKRWENQIMYFPVISPDTFPNVPGLVFIGLNTAYAVHYNQRLAQMDTGAISKLIKEIRSEYPKDKWIRVLVFHHGFVQRIEDVKSKARDYINQNDLGNIINSDVIGLIIHGHSHEHKPQLIVECQGDKLPVIGAGSISAPGGARRKGIGLEYNLIEVNLASGKGKVFPRRRSREDGKWSIHSELVKEEGKAFYEILLNAQTGFWNQFKTGEQEKKEPKQKGYQSSLLREEHFERIIHVLNLRKCREDLNCCQNNSDDSCDLPILSSCFAAETARFSGFLKKSIEISTILSDIYEVTGIEKISEQMPRKLYSYTKQLYKCLDEITRPGLSDIEDKLSKHKKILKHRCFGVHDAPYFIEQLLDDLDQFCNNYKETSKVKKIRTQKEMKDILYSVQFSIKKVIEALVNNIQTHLVLTANTIKFEFNDKKNSKVINKLEKSREKLPHNAGISSPVFRD